MSNHVINVIKCDTDGCRRTTTGVADVPLVDVMRKALGSGGWKMDGADILCPVHSGKGVMFEGRLILLEDEPKPVDGTVQR